MSFFVRRILVSIFLWCFFVRAFCHVRAFFIFRPFFVLHFFVHGKSALLARPGPGQLKNARPTWPSQFGLAFFVIRKSFFIHALFCLYFYLRQFFRFVLLLGVRFLHIFLYMIFFNPYSSFLRFSFIHLSRLSIFSPCRAKVLSQGLG